MLYLHVTELLCCVGVLCVFSVSSQTGCVNGWFGLYCQHKCQCSSNNCDNIGQCRGKSICNRGHFGPACQYVDLAFSCGEVMELTDGNDSTCVTPKADKSISVPLNESLIFTWLRLVISKPDVIGDIEVSFSNNGSRSDCTNQRYTSVNNRSTDIHCDLSYPVDEVILSGAGTRYLCSLYVSGGRNLALREKTVQSSTHSEKSDETFQLNISFTASKAVDGKTSQSPYDGYSCSMTQQSPMKKEFWMITFPSNRIVTRYVIYGRTDTMDVDLRLCNFSLDSTDEAGNVVYHYTDTPTEELLDFMTIIHTPRSVLSVSIYNNYFPRSLTLCEVKIYGDTDCDPGKYGIECQHTCQCPANASCVSSTGECPTSSPVLSKNTTCAPEFFGPDCAFKCSEFCAKNTVGARSCQGPNGTCDEGCLNGYIEPTCIERCAAGTFGKDCKESCSAKCLEGKDATVSPCHHASGVCLLGCKTGADGPMCITKVQSTIRDQSTGGEDSSYLGLLIGLLVCVLLFVSAITCLRKKKPGTTARKEELSRCK